jgi:molybdopterin/thiamine biosynthesis adenylyltransferase
MAHVLQVGAGSGGMPVLDLLAREPRITQVTLIEPDIYKPHNVERHLFPPSEIGNPKAEAAYRWLKERRPDLQVQLLLCDVAAPAEQAAIEQAAAASDIGVCAADNEPAKYHWDALMRRHRKPWTLGEVLSGGIGGFVHWFVPGGACYGCVASHLQRSVAVEKPKAPDYSQPGGAMAETTIPASRGSIQAIAALHALVTLQILDSRAQMSSDGSEAPEHLLADLMGRLGFTSLLLTLQKVPDVFDEPFRPYRFRIPRSAECLICQAASGPAPSSAEDLDVALDQALARLGHA